jgi:hypothetical protein
MAATVDVEIWARVGDRGYRLGVATLSLKDPRHLSVLESAKALQGQAEVLVDIVLEDGDFALPIDTKDN